ncbi:uncharacterized protein LOC133134038 [Conger conger]|uniref:uncharacterized protein LOC133134038 n=1 Tax=Conger conger TaxID=82655 RepID=UPI002A5A8585|nr:uncharacterized protein LOC133134038 [Conger conger]
MNELKEIVEDIEASIEQFHQALNEFKECHQSVQELLEGEEKTADNEDWYQPRMQTFETFYVTDVGAWRANQFMQAQAAQAAVSHLDGISNSGKAEQSQTVVSRVSRSSSVSSARLKAEAEKAALLQRTAALQKKHALERERIEVQNAIERVELETELAAAQAKVQVFECIDVEATNSKFTSTELSELPGDGMNAYLESHYARIHPELSPVQYAKISVVPKTPLQRVLTQDARPKRPLQPAHSIPLNPANHNAAGSSRPPMPSSSINNNLGAIADLIVQQQKLTSLPTRNVTVFNGEPLNFKPFMLAFQHCIENNTNSSQDRLYYLEQYTSGQPKELVRSCLHMDADRGYAEAKRLLEHHFGDEFKITNAYLDKALNWSNIPTDNGEALQSYTLFLRGCCNVMRTLWYMDELNLPSNLRLPISKVPYKLREKWRACAFDIRERTGARDTFDNLVHFLERQARILQDPIFGNLQDATATKRPPKATISVTKPILSPKQKTRGSSFATTVAAVPHDNAARSTAESTVQVSRVSIMPKLCPVCNGEHDIADCQELVLKEPQMTMQ